MIDILLRAGCLIFIIFLGWILKKIGVFKKEDFTVLSKIAIRITLTATIIINFSGREIDLSALSLAVIALVFGLILMGSASVVNKKYGPYNQAFAMLNTAGVNIGNFCIPFAQSFLGATGVLAASIFDIGNSFICLGGNYAVSSSIQEGKKKITFLPILKAMSKSPAFITYLVMLTLSLCHITLPTPVTDCAQIIANANAFMAMFMLGVGFELSADKAKIAMMARVLSVRYVFGISLAILAYFTFPLALGYRQALVVLFLGPIAGAAPGFTAEMKNDFGLAAAVNSMSILVSIVLIITALTIMLG